MSLASRVIKKINESRIHEKFPNEFWKQLYKSGSRSNVISSLNRVNIDIENSNINPIQITSARDHRWKENGILILIGDDGSIVVKDGNLISENDYLFSDNVSWKSSYKTIINAGTKIWFIPEADYISNSALKAKRKEIKSGDINLNRREHAQRYDPYRDNWTSDVDGAGHHYDKSGYKLDPEKYKNKLREIKVNNSGWKKDAEAALEEYESYIDMIRSNPRNISKGLASKINSQGLFTSRRRAMSFLADLGDAIERTFKSAEKLEQVKSKGYSQEKINFRTYDLENEIENLNGTRKEVRKFFDKVFN